jgi:hypothetical protein
MNTEEKFVHPDIDTMKSEHAPTTLPARILTKLQQTEEKTMIRSRNRVVRFALSAALVLSLGAGTLMMTNTASAAGILKVHEAFQDASRYHVKSYQIAEGKRRLVSETWVDGSKNHSVFYDENGKSIDLDLSWINTEMPGELTKKIQALTPAQMADHKVMQKILDEVISVFELPGGVTIGDTKILVAGPDGKLSKEAMSTLPPEFRKALEAGKAEIQIFGAEGIQLDLDTILQSAGGDVKIITDPKEMEKLAKEMGIEMDKVDFLKGTKLFGGDLADVKILDGGMIAAPVMMGGENGVEYLRKLMSDKKLWDIKPGVSLNGRVLDHYKLKDGLVNLELFVNPITGLPVMTRTSFGEGKDAFVIEDEYDYVTPIPAKPQAKPQAKAKN